jgi:hypothetical protein
MVVGTRVEGMRMALPRLIEPSVSHEPAGRGDVRLRSVLTVLGFQRYRPIPLDDAR